MEGQALSNRWLSRFPGANYQRYTKVRKVVTACNQYGNFFIFLPSFFADGCANQKPTHKQNDLLENQRRKRDCERTTEGKE